MGRGGESDLHNLALSSSLSAFDLRASEVMLTCDGFRVARSAYMANLSGSNGADSSGVCRAHSSLSSCPLILIVEDHEDTRFLLRALVGMRGMRVVEAEDGEAGVRAAEEIRPDLILMDVSLPHLDRLAATRMIRERESLRRMPVVILSGHAALQSQEAAREAGCSDYLVKPFQCDELNRILHKHLASRLMNVTADEKHAL